MIINKKYLLGLFLIVMTTKAYSHGEQIFKWTTITAYGLYDTKNEKIFPSFDVNVCHYILNGGIEYKHISYIDSKRLSVHAGLGLANVIQLQAGFSGDGFSLRNRYDLMVGSMFEKFAKKHPYAGLTTISINVEKYFNNSQMNWFFGIGLGFSINNAWGLNFF
jgi:hypothetical protein